MGGTRRGEEKKKVGLRRKKAERRRVFRSKGKRVEFKQEKEGS